MMNYIYNLATDKDQRRISSLVKAFLFLLSFIYGLLVRPLSFFNRLFPYRIGCKVISVGNITLGGTGKTSLVSLIARYLKDKGHKPAVLTRGYKRKIKSGEAGFPSCANMGDEPYMLKMNLTGVPVIVGADRAVTANSAICGHGADTVILDDGFQQWRLKKDMEIVTIDATCPFGNRNLIPRGILREPLSSLRRADIFVLTKTNLKPDNRGLKDFLMSVNPGGLIVESAHYPLGFYGIDREGGPLETDALRGKTVTLFSGIGDPGSFESLITGLGIEAGLVFRFTDHHSYSQKEIGNILRESQKKDISTIITTEKDAARLYGLLPQGHGLRILYMRIELKITANEQEFHNRLLGLYSS